MVFLLFGITLLFIRNITFQSQIEKEERMQIASMLETAYGFTTMHRVALDNDPDNEEEKQLLLLNSNNLDILYDMRSMVTSENDLQKLQLENDLYTGIEEYMVAGGEPLLPPKEMEHRTLLNDKLMEENIKPQHDRYSLALPNFMKQIVDLLLGFGAIALVILVLGDKLSYEYENRTIHLLFTQPFNKQRIITSKFFSSCMIYLLILVFILIVAAIIGGIFGEAGTFSYPLTAEKNDVIYYMTIGEYLTRALTVILATIIFIISLILFYSQLFKQTLPTLFVLVLTIGAGFLIKLFVPWEALNWFNPFQYVYGQATILFQNERVWYQGIPVLIILSILLYLFSLRKIKTSKLD